MAKWISRFAALAVVLFSALPARAQYTSGATPVELRDQCLSQAELDRMKAIRALKRATTSAESPTFNPDSLLGTWKMNFLAADAPWGPGGEVTGTVTFKYVENCYYEGQLQATGPGGNYTAKIQLIYHELSKHLTWIETDSRGFTVVRLGDIAGMGGQLTWRWESVPFTYKGKLVRMRGTLFTASPDHVLQNIMMSVDGVNQRLGNPELAKDLTVPPPPKKDASTTTTPK
jgi:uncharacterized protein DUF1579